ncbi:MAG: hypothetical protein H7144_16360 [Burkholderiales bacterium]|nr:hypothetical protein [Phycisphaerae bacterium]
MAEQLMGKIFRSLTALSIAMSALAFILSPQGVARAAEWQWSVDVPVVEGSKERPRAFLWIPPDCERVRGVVVGQHNMEEEAILEHPAFRKTLAEIGFAEVWVAPGFDAYFRFDQGAGEKFEAMMSSLATQSGYDEIAYAPLVPIGHSAAASMPWYIAAWKPERVLAGLSISGQWPYVVDEKNAPHVGGRSIDSIPALVTMGEYEWADENLPKGLKVRAEHPTMPLTAIGCPADGHFAAMDEKVELLSFYLKKAVLYRLPADAPTDRAPQLTPIDPTTSGWLFDRFRTNRDPAFPAAPASEYKGNRAEAFWCFDEEMARKIQAFQRLHRGKPALLGFVQDGQTAPQKNGTHQQVTLQFAPQEDGITFKLSGDFLDTVPEGRPARWAAMPAGSSIEKPTDGPPIEIRRITGPVRKIAADTWVLDFYRGSFLNDRRGNDAWLVAIWEGNDQYKRAVQQSLLKIPGRLSEGKPQTITFPAPPDITAGTREIALRATSDSGESVRYFVVSGPAEIEGSTLKILPIPPRAKFPVRITVTAWQFGRAAEPKLQSAAPVTQTILINQPPR